MPPKRTEPHADILEVVGLNDLVDNSHARLTVRYEGKRAVTLTIDRVRRASTGSYLYCVGNDHQHGPYDTLSEALGAGILRVSNLWSEGE
jgi:hypothetical protein